MTIVNATPEQLASQDRIKRRAKAILDQRSRRTTAQILADRPDLGDLRLPGIALADVWQWSA